MGRYHRPQTTMGSIPNAVLSQQSTIMQNTRTHALRPQHATPPHGRRLPTCHAELSRQTSTTRRHRGYHYTARVYIPHTTILGENMRKTMQEIRSQGKTKLNQERLEPGIHGTQSTPDLPDRNQTTCHRGKKKTTLENDRRSQDQHRTHHGLLGVTGSRTTTETGRGKIAIQRNRERTGMVEDTATHTHGSGV